ncbi:MAG: hypothetical protein R3D31_14985 [Hyphomicrobiaceae bacterium]
MASNLSCIGFSFADNESFVDAMVKLATQAVETLTTPAGDYGIWRSASGAEIWFHLARQGDSSEIMGLTPFYEGESTVQVALTTALRRPEDNAFEGAFYAWVAPDAEGSGAYPLVFDAVDFAAVDAGTFPLKVDVRLTGFAQELQAWPNEAAYLASNDSEDQATLAPEAFIPIGLFAAAEGASDGDEASAPSSMALLTGRVVAHRVLTNEETGDTFHWLLVKSLEASYDIVADPAVVKGPLGVDAVVRIGGAFFGRIL